MKSGQRGIVKFDGCKTIIVNHMSKIRRQKLRNEATIAEKTLWHYLRKNRVKNVKFRRQHSIGPYIVDFYAPQVKLVIEVDGPTHYEEKAIMFDKERTKFIESNGIKVIRFTNNEVYTNIDGILTVIENMIDECMS
ncbi:MAG: endonuclease domain-containing protein [Spirochaetota bacterium]